eukprot:scaffold101256_cov72-Phaeocystis_antarctica.AAC.2
MAHYDGSTYYGYTTTYYGYTYYGYTYSGTCLARSAYSTSVSSREQAWVGATPVVLAVQSGRERHLITDPLGDAQFRRGVDAIQGGTRRPERSLHQEAGRLLVRRDGVRCLVRRDVVDAARADARPAVERRVDRDTGVDRDTAVEIERCAALRPLPVASVVGASNWLGVDMQDAKRAGGAVGQADDYGGRSQRRGEQGVDGYPHVVELGYETNLNDRALLWSEIAGSQTKQREGYGALQPQVLNKVLVLVTTTDTSTPTKQSKQYAQAERPTALSTRRRTSWRRRGLSAALAPSAS